MKKRRDFVKATGLFSGLRVPQSARGKYVLVNDGKVLKTANSPRALLQAAAKMDVRAVILHVPLKEKLLAAY